MSSALATAHASTPLRVLTLDGGGAKGFYTLGILDELEKNTRHLLCETFDLVFGTSTGSIIAALIARGESTETIINLYKAHVPTIMRGRNSVARSAALRQLAEELFESTTVSDFRTRIGIVATNWKEGRPFVFKHAADQAHGSAGSFVPFFGCSISDAVVASCSAYPFFETVSLTTSKGTLELGDGGFCANNPALYALADATGPLGFQPDNVRLVSLGVGSYPPPSFWRNAGRALGGWGIVRHSLNSDFLQKIFDTNTGAMEQLTGILFKKVPMIRISETFSEPEMATDLLEHDLAKLDRLLHKGRRSYEKNEGLLKSLLDYK